MTPRVVNGSVKPNQRSRYWPNRPRRPYEKNNATPPTTGGSTIDSVHNARTTPRPQNRTLASSHASGTPKNTDNAAADSEHLIESHSAVRTDGCLSICHILPHGARHNRPTNGSAKNAM